jgi:hypothetical protein
MSMISFVFRRFRRGFLKKELAAKPPRPRSGVQTRRRMRRRRFVHAHHPRSTQMCTHDHARASHHTYVQRSRKKRSSTPLHTLSTLSTQTKHLHTTRRHTHANAPCACAHTCAHASERIPHLLAFHAGERQWIPLRWERKRGGRKEGFW